VSRTKDYALDRPLQQDDPSMSEIIEHLDPIHLGYGQIAASLAKAQAEMSNPAFDSVNPHFKNSYASLAAIRDAVVPVLARHGIAMTQDLTTAEGRVSCATVLWHSSGEVMRFGPLTLPVSKEDAQGYASASTYARRYSLMSVAGVCGDVDDDANVASGKPAAAVEHAPPPSGFDHWWNDLRSAKIEAALEAAWQAAPPGCRAYVTRIRAADWEALKAAVKA
jgi:hypothetical protein